MLTEAEIAKWVNGLAALDRDNEVILLSIFACFGIPKSYLDVGSGDGAMANTAEKLGVEVNGLDQLPRPNHPKLLQVDLRQPQDLKRKFELVTSIEVAEHLEAEYADILIDTITRHADKRIIFTAAMPGQPGDGHVNCVIGDTSLRASNIRAAMRRHYDGQVVTIKTRGGNELTITPNHPILTQSGWVAANRLSKGDNVISRRRTDGVVAGIMPNYEERPTRAQEIFSTLAEMQEARRYGVPTTAEDFHGDGRDGNVEIVPTHGLTEFDFDMALLKPISHLTVKRRDVAACSFSALSTLGFDARRISLAASSSIGAVCQLSPVALAQPSITQADAFLHGANFNPIALQNTTDRRIAYTEPLGNGDRGLSSLVTLNDVGDVSNGLSRRANISDRYTFSHYDTAGRPIINVSRDSQLTQRLSRLIALDEIVEIQSSYFSGHVYNLSTESEWYFANDIITHNCQPALYWRQKFYQRHWEYRPAETYRLALILATAQQASHHVEANLQVFTR